jgi:hypothetical protein
MAVVYREIEEEILPPLRRVENQRLIVLSLRKLMKRLQTLQQVNPSQLTKGDYFMLQHLLKMLILRSTYLSERYYTIPNDWRGFNNLAVVNMWNNNLVKLHQA